MENVHDWLTLVQWAGCVFGVLGALLLAMKDGRSGYGFVLFLASNGFWLAFGLLTRADGLVAQQLVFTATSLFGIWRWRIAPHQAALRAQAGRPACLPARTK